MNDHSSLWRAAKFAPIEETIHDFIVEREQKKRREKNDKDVGLLKKNVELRNVDEIPSA